MSKIRRRLTLTPWPSPVRRPLAGTCLLAVAVVANLGLSGRCLAQAVDPHTALEDAKLYFTAPLRWDEADWLRFGTTLVAIGIAHEYDDDVRTHFARSSLATLKRADRHDARDALPAAVLVAGTWIYAAWLDSPGGYSELGSMLEAGVLSAASTEILKYSLGRERPNETTQVDSWFNSADSFPSMHVSAAFAIGTVFAESGNERYRWIRRVLGYGVAGATAYVRVHDNAHWMTDALAGAALGFTTAHFVMNRRAGPRTDASIMLAPVDQGLMLTYSRPLR